ncbi:MAG: AAA family ATPase, partial [Myxococcales bacterium]|nr:AAA family ATPase [Myxococcales bacterium]
MRETAEGRWELTWSAVRGQPLPDDTHVGQLMWGPGESWTARVDLVHTAPNRIVVRGTPVRPTPGEHAWIAAPDFLGALLAWMDEHAGELSGDLFARARARPSRTDPELQPRPGLRSGQLRALDASRGSRSVVWGPPGTGKTTTLGAIAAAHISAGRRVLLLSSNNVAVDGLLLATDDALQDLGCRVVPGDLLRTRAPILPAMTERAHLLAWSRAASSFADRRAGAAEHRRARLRAGDDVADVESEH